MAAIFCPPRECSWLAHLNAVALAAEQQWRGDAQKWASFGRRQTAFSR